MTDQQHTALVVISVVQLVLLLAVLAGVIYLSWRIRRVDRYLDQP